MRSRKSPLEAPDRASEHAPLHDQVGMDHEPPDFRATVSRAGTVRLIDWGPWLVAGGPLHTMLEARGRAGVGIADLTVIHDNDDVAVEVIVDFRCGEREQHRRALCRWAEFAGYRRAWFDGEIVELEPTPGGPAHTRCTGCRARFVDSDASFWEFARHRGAFPTSCCLCGSDLPQWTPVDQGKTSRPAARRNEKSTSNRERSNQ